MIGSVPTRFYAVACAAIVLSVAALLLSLQEDAAWIAAVAGAIAALGGFAAARMLKDDR
jgi:hypothetical protein